MKIRQKVAAAAIAVVAAGGVALTAASTAQASEVLGNFHSYQACVDYAFAKFGTGAGWDCRAYQYDAATTIWRLIKF
ncbi:hypothetical protein [Prescottella agglutinans]|uniref:Uncharacterized protein n=1 Tax=Prescottella agglutinans TaxID=1644129 RepID=A0ABT6MHZ2_9NOCA|nr:hypothetical protein [Prescottella agglutinans]MDH6283935.1 hypothetical protein [Prescottella agglutinans]